MSPRRCRAIANPSISATSATKVWVLYVDGFCARCRAAGRRLQRLDWLGKLEVKSFRHTTDYLALGVTAERLDREMVLVERDTKRAFGGARALERLSRQLPALWPLVPVLAVMRFGGLSDRVYRWFAARRLIVVEPGWCSPEECDTGSL